MENPCLRLRSRLGGAIAEQSGVGSILRAVPLREGIGSRQNRIDEPWIQVWRADLHEANMLAVYFTK